MKCALGRQATTSVTYQPGQFVRFPRDPHEEGCNFGPHAHRIGNRPGTVGADLVAVLRNIQSKEIEMETEHSAKQK